MGKKTYEGQDGTKFTKGGTASGKKPAGVYTGKDGTEIDTRGRSGKGGGGKKGCLLIVLCLAFPILVAIGSLLA